MTVTLSDETRRTNEYMAKIWAKRIKAGDSADVECWLLMAAGFMAALTEALQEIATDGRDINPALIQTLACAAEFADRARILIRVGETYTDPTNAHYLRGYDDGRRAVNKRLAVAA